MVSRIFEVVRERDRHLSTASICRPTVQRPWRDGGRKIVAALVRQHSLAANSRRPTNSPAMKSRERPGTARWRDDRLNRTPPSQRTDGWNQGTSACVSTATPVPDPILIGEVCRDDCPAHSIARHTVSSTAHLGQLDCVVDKVVEGCPQIEDFDGDRCPTRSNPACKCGCKLDPLPH